MKTYKELQESIRPRYDDFDHQRHRCPNCGQSIGNKQVHFCPNPHGLGKPRCPHPDCPHEREHDWIYPRKPLRPRDHIFKPINPTLMNESWEKHKKIFQDAYSFLDDNQKRKIKGSYNLNTLKKMHSDAVNRITQNFPNYSWTHDKIHTYSPSEEGYGTHYITSQTEDDETGHNFLVSSYYEDGHHISSICYGS